ncbi:hypothetical protein [Zooshikella ganghwensis]|uniref:hypothetical protein n=1 Tax=Zooshikella ganghwensis TaxID=202772 RepID=UPI00040A9FE5|nr:hypothetical protein [Zooshikella ganghwensis]
MNDRSKTQESLIQIQAKSACEPYLTDKECRQALKAIYQEVRQLLKPKETNDKQISPGLLRESRTE